MKKPQHKSLVLNGKTAKGLAPIKQLVFKLKKNMEKVLELARKLKELADRGIGGEKENAQVMLERLMKKHHITIDMIDSSDSIDRKFKITKEEFKFWRQIVANVLGEIGIGSYTNERTKKKSYFVKCTSCEFIEIQAKFEFFYKIYEEEQKIFYSAFIQAQHLYLKESADSDAKEQAKELSPEEKAKLYKMMNMMKGLDRHIFQKQLSNK